MTVPQATPQIATPPVTKTVLTCCGYTCLMGTPFTWKCPACGKEHRPPVHDLPPATPQTSPLNLE